MKIIDLIKTKNIQIELVKVESYSKNKQNDKANSLAKKRSNRSRNNID